MKCGRRGDYRWSSFTWAREIVAWRLAMLWTEFGRLRWSASMGQESFLVMWVSSFDWKARFWFGLRDVWLRVEIDRMVEYQRVGWVVGGSDGVVELCTRTVMFLVSFFWVWFLTWSEERGLEVVTRVCIQVVFRW